MKRSLRSIVFLALLAFAQAGMAQEDGFKAIRVGCGRAYGYDDYHVSYTFHDGYTWAHVWYHGHAETVQGEAGDQIGATTTTYYTTPDGQVVLVGNYPSDHYDVVAQVDDCGAPVDDTDDAHPIETAAFDASTGRTAEVYIFADYVLGERTDIPAEVDAHGGLKVTLQVDQWMPGMRYAVLMDGVYQRTFALGETFGEVEWSV